MDKIAKLEKEIKRLEKKRDKLDKRGMLQERYLSKEIVV